jgi:formamidopyrimidine-DNA glycosylase
MPEAPEMRALAAYFGNHYVGTPLRSLRIASLSALKTYSPSPDDLVDGQLTKATARAKYLQLWFGDVVVVVHLSRGGWIKELVNAPKVVPKPGRGPLAARIEWADNRFVDITEAGTEKRLAIWVTRDPNEVAQIATLGPEADQVGLQQLGELLVAAGRSPIKNVVRDQTVIAGIGNAWSDEILHRAKLSPFQPASTMSDTQIELLHRSIAVVLRDAQERLAELPLSQMKDSKRTAMAVHARDGQPCPVCNDVVRSVSFATRSLQYCATCQTGGKVLADRRLSRLLK